MVLVDGLKNSTNFVLKMVLVFLNTECTLTYLKRLGPN